MEKNEIIRLSFSYFTDLIPNYPKVLQVFILPGRETDYQTNTVTKGPGTILNALIINNNNKKTNKIIFVIIKAILNPVCKNKSQKLTKLGT